MRILQPLLLALLFCICDASFSQVGINTATPLSTLDVNGNLSVKVVTLNGSNSVTNISDGVYISLAPVAQDQEFKLPSAVDYPGRVYILRNIYNSTAKLTTAAGNFYIKGTTASQGNTLYMYDNHYRTIIVISDGTNWTVFENYTP